MPAHLRFQRSQPAVSRRALYFAIGVGLACAVAAACSSPEGKPGGSAGGSSAGTMNEMGVESGGAPNGEAETSSGGEPSSNGEAGAAPNEMESAGAGGDTTEAGVHGIVLDSATKRPLFGRTISIGALNTKSDEQGAFQLRSANPVYDLTIADADGSTISIYQGLTRRDPVLLHRHSSFGIDTAYSASIAGTLSKPDAESLTSKDVAVVQFFSAAGDDHTLLGGSVPPYAPDYGLFLRWRGVSSIAGTLVARAIVEPTQSSADPRLHFFVQREVTLQDGEMRLESLTLSPVSTKQLTGTVALPNGIRLTQLQEYYRLPLPNAVIAINNFVDPSPNFAHEVDDLAGDGKQLCVMAISNTPSSLSTERCGLATHSNNVSITLQVAPSLLAPAAGDVLTKNTQFSWSPFENGVYLLQLEPAVPSRSTPNIDLYTTKTSASWPARSVDPSLATFYECSVGGLGPFTSIDDAASAEGLGAIIRPELRRSFSPPLELTTGP